MVFAIKLELTNYSYVSFNHLIIHLTAPEQILASVSYLQYGSYEFSWLFLSHMHFSDGETFISADDLRINLWNLEISNQSFNIVDVKPANMEDLTGKVLGIVEISNMFWLFLVLFICSDFC